MLVLAVGVRPAARQLGISEDTVADWSRQGKWLAGTRPTPATIRPPASMVSPSSPSITPADALAATLADRHKRTKLGLSAWAASSSEHLSTLTGEEAAAAHQAALGTASVAGKVWPEQAAPSIRLSIYGQAAPVLDVEMDVEQIGDSVEQA